MGPLKRAGQGSQALDVDPIKDLQDRFPTDAYNLTYGLDTGRASSRVLRIYNTLALLNRHIHYIKYVWWKLASMCRMLDSPLAADRCRSPGYSELVTSTVPSVP